MGSLLVFTSPVLAHTSGQSLSDQARLNELTIEAFQKAKTLLLAQGNEEDVQIIDELLQ